MVFDRISRWCVLALLVLALAGCGGGGGGGSDDDDDGNDGADPGEPNATLNADAGDDRDVVTGTTVTLDGSDSTVSDDASLEFAWRLVSTPDDSDAEIADGDTATPRFSADADGTYVAELTVADGRGNEATDRVTVTATSGNTRPSADAGADQAVKTGAEVTLDGTGSRDADGDDLSYRWAFVSQPSGSSASLDDANAATPAFVAEAAGDYTLSLVVNDGERDSREDRVTVTASTANSAPVADAGPDRNVSVNDTATLDGRGSSDADEDDLSYDWRIVSRPDDSAASLADPNDAQPSLTTDAVGDYIVELTVSDGQASDTDRATVSAGPVLVLSVDRGNPVDGSPDYTAIDANIFASQLTITEIPDGANTLGSLRVGRFRLEAVGQAYTIDDLRYEVVRSTSDGNEPDLSVDGLASGDTVVAGDSLAFATIAENIAVPGEYRFDFMFTVRETGEDYRLTFRVDLTDAD
ncbi:PKD domain-containing protein [Salinisphaera orenii]|uniref:PKD/Chitinase domain-containing protein n=1 Tax=Salinisphaera orenii YIM 95161 TaxID=1051139 RepID=A0A423QB21_9GAMM|nr:PKD domain-containing protein [Salinisphaera halophila]ROO37791.1 hypothetical protein SAHL_00310 [Salinisphaera halophila YIM 95161]